MINKISLTICFFLVSCGHTYTARVVQGYGEQFALGDFLNHRGSGVPINADYTSTQIGPTFRKEKFRLDMLGGFWASFPRTGESSVAAGVLVTPRAVYEFGYFNPFVNLDLGLGHARWEMQGSDFGFLVGGGGGILIPVDELWSLSVGYSLLHYSNAGIASPNPGINTDRLDLGIELSF